MSSRLCVKNLPKGADERRLREVFSQKGEVTDAKVMRTKDGKSRQFAFIGFRTKEEAEEALKYFNNTYIDTCKITCEVPYFVINFHFLFLAFAMAARKIGDPDAPRPWSRHSLKKPENDSKDKANAGVVNALPKGSKGQGKPADVRDSKGSVANDPKFQEFLEVMQPRSKAKMWANDTAGTLPSTAKDGTVVTEASKRPQKNVPGSEEDTSSEDDSDKEMIDGSSSEDAAEELQINSKQDNDMTDMDFFKSKIKKNWSDSESDGEDSSDESNATNDSETSSDESSDADEKSQLVDLKGNLDKKNNVDNDSNAEHTGMQEVEDPDSKESEDLGGIQKETKNSGGQGKEDDEAALVTDEKKLALETGRLFICNLPYATTYIVSFEEELVELCSQYGDVEQAHIVVDKTTKLSTGRGYVLFRLPDSAVRALDELDNSSFQGRLLRVQAAKPLNNKKFESNHVTVEKKMSLKEKKLEQKKSSEVGGDTTAWNSFYMRQDTVVENIARKNGISKSELLDREADDLAVRIALGIALIMYFCKCFFFFIIYSSWYRDTPLYLEWAPENILCPDSVRVDEDEKNTIGERIVTKAIFDQTVEGVSAEEIDPDRVESRSVFVKNLNFKTTDDSLKQHFSAKLKSGSLKSVKVKKHVKNGKNVSMGFGFVEFDSVETATSVCKDLQGTVLDGHALILQLCHGRKDGQTAKQNDKDKSSTKLLVRNVAFEATEKDLRQLFSPFGQIKSLRLPMKFGTHRGFAFVEYVTKQEAQNALQALASTHLYGRHLVIERAKEGETLEELRARTAAQFVDEHTGFQRLSKKRKQGSLVDEGSVKFSRIVE
ncbi:hypothetical protein PR202_gb06195 [Eleusine coracana subsp. coracana]|uniref:RRM domain-containing protein n=1 Tax=Eleusine coracana subsp. coracana TaxID=191504 RepID=A0AAV5E923_ELECO|nr:hypothetical protein PR202_gb06195 [Eleusine coracana subsp. coracana]